MIVSLHITHSSAGGMACFNDIIPHGEDMIESALKTDEDVDEYVLIRTCNRLEAYIATENNHDVRLMLENAVKKAIPFENRDFWYILQDRESVKHLFTVVCGIDSLIVGEDQIQHQVKDSFKKAKEDGHVGKVLYTLFNNAIIVGKRVRTETDLNKGAVSVGYAAIELAESRIGDLGNKNIAIFGAGEMAALIAKNLAGKNPETVFVSNRTFHRAQELAKELDGVAVGMDRMEDVVSKSDLVLVATSARDPFIKKANVERAMSQRPNRPLLIIDVSVPLNVTSDVSEVPGVSLSTMDSLDAIAARNVAMRKREISSAEKIINQELERVRTQKKIEVANEIIRCVSMRCENVREAEADRAKSRLGKGDDEGVIDAMSHSMINKINAEIIKNLRRAAAEGDIRTCEAAAKLFGIDI